jgi:hypothetical protein
MSRSFARICKDNLQLQDPIFCIPRGIGRENISPKFFFTGTSSGANLPNESEELQDRDSSQGTRENHQPPVGRRFLIFTLGYIGGFFICVKGVRLINDYYRISGWCLLILGSLTAVAGTALWFATGFFGSWSWPI